MAITLNQSSLDNILLSAAYRLNKAYSYNDNHIVAVLHYGIGVL